jgi:phospholipase/carboxylesterase
MFDKIETVAAESASASVIWLHGLGASGDDFLDIVPQLALPESVRFVFPHAPVRPVTLNGGMVMPAWFDILSLDREADQDEPGIKAAAHQLSAIIDQEIASGIPAEKIVLMGFSQGGALALYTGLLYPQALAGMIGLSTYLPLADTIDAADILHSEVPVALAHGHDDDVVSIDFCAQTQAFLEEWGYSVDSQAYPMAHQICWQEVRHIGEWLRLMLRV